MSVGEAVVVKDKGCTVRQERERARMCCKLNCVREHVCEL